MKGGNMPQNPIEFDYTKLPEQQQHIIKEHSAAIGRHMAGTTLAMIDIGRRLQAVRELVETHLFRQWLKYEFEWSVQVAYTYMKSAEVMGDLDCIENFVPTAVQILSKECTPASAREEAIAMARAGTKINTAVAKNLLLQHATTPDGATNTTPAEEPAPNLLEVLGALRANLPRLVDQLTDTEREELAETLTIAASTIYQFADSESRDCIPA